MASGTDLIGNTIIAGNTADQADTRRIRAPTPPKATSSSATAPAPPALSRPIRSAPAPRRSSHCSERLANYGGPIPTVPLLPGSPAIDAGSNTLTSQRRSDHRWSREPAIHASSIPTSISARSKAAASPSLRPPDRVSPPRSEASSVRPLGVTVTANNAFRTGCRWNDYICRADVRCIGELFDQPDHSRQIMAPAPPPPPPTTTSRRTVQRHRRRKRHHDAGDAQSHQYLQHPDRHPKHRIAAGQRRHRHDQRCQLRPPPPPTTPSCSMTARSARSPASQAHRSPSPSRPDPTTVSITNGSGFRYVRYVAPSGSYGNIAEFNVFGS